MRRATASLPGSTSLLSGADVSDLCPDCEEAYILYHATLACNEPSILAKGLTPRTESQCETMVDEMLAKRGLTRAQVEPWQWQSPLQRCKETAGKVYLSGKREYAEGNCYAGGEVESDLCRVLSTKKWAGADYERFHQDLGGCVVCEVEVPASTSLLGGSHADRWSHDTVGKSVHRLYEHLMERYSTHPDEFVDLMGRPPDHEMARAAIVEYQLGPVPPQWVRRCVPIGATPA